jgi:hypothetical protein
MERIAQTNMKNLTDYVDDYKQDIAKNSGKLLTVNSTPSSKASNVNAINANTSRKTATNASVAATNANSVRRTVSANATKRNANVVATPTPSFNTPKTTNSNSKKNVQPAQPAQPAQPSRWF